MARRIRLTTKLSVEELERRYRGASEGMERSHWQLIGLLAQGHPACTVAKMPGYSAYWIGQIAQRFNEEGEEGLVTHRKRSHPSPHALLAPPQPLDALRTALAGPAPHADLWTSRTVAAWLSARAGRTVSRRTALRYLHKVDFTSQAPRPRHVKAASPEERAAFKKRWRARERRCRERIRRPWLRSGRPTSIASGQRPIVRRVWAPRGKRPVVEVHPRYRWRYRSGVVHPASGRTQWHLSSGISVELFASSLHHFAGQAGAGPDKELVGVLATAGWHTSPRVAVPEHLHLVPWPAYTPERQPAERLWPLTNTPLVNARPADLDELDTLQLDRCAVLQTEPSYIAAIQSATHYHWWPADYSPTT